MCQKEIRPHFSCTFRQHTHNGLKNKNRKVPKISNKRKSKYKNKIKNNNSNTALKKRDLLTAGDGITFFGYLFVTAIYTGDWRVNCTWLFEKKVMHIHTYLYTYTPYLYTSIAVSRFAIEMRCYLWVVGRQRPTLKCQSELKRRF